MKKSKKEEAVKAGRKPNTPRKINYDTTLKKHINLINCSQSQLSLRESKIWNALLIIAYQNQIKINKSKTSSDSNLITLTEITPDWIEIDSGDLKKFAGQSQVRKNDLESCLRKIQKVSIEKVDIRDNHGVEVEVLHGTSLITEFEMVKNVKTNDLIRARFKLPELIRHAQVNPGIYASLDLPKLNTYRSRYAYHLDPFIRVNFNKYNFTKIIDIEDYRAVVGVPENAFINRNDNLFTKAAKLPLEEIKEKFPELRDLTCRVVKKGRSITGIEFSRRRTSSPITDANIPGYDELLHKFNFSSDQIHEMRSKFDDERIYAVMQYCYKMYLKNKSTENEIRDLKSYTVSCLNKNIDTEKSRLETVDQEEKEIKQIEKARKKSDHDILTNLLKEHNKLVNELAQEYFNNLYDQEKSLLIEKIKEQNKEELLQINWDPENGFNDKHSEFVLIGHVIECGFVDKDDTDFSNYVFNKTGRRIEHVDNGIYHFVDQIEDDFIEDDIINDLINLFVSDYKTAVAKLLLSSKKGAFHRKMYSNNGQDSEDDIIKKMSEDEDLMTFSIDDICELNNMFLKIEPELSLKVSDNLITTEKEIMNQLYAVLPRDTTSIASLIM